MYIKTSEVITEKTICQISLSAKSYFYTCFELIHLSIFKNIVAKGQSKELKADLSYLANIGHLTEQT